MGAPFGIDGPPSSSLELSAHRARQPNALALAARCHRHAGRARADTRASRPPTASRGSSRASRPAARRPRRDAASPRRDQADPAAMLERVGRDPVHARRRHAPGRGHRPGNVHGIDELRLATRHVELAVAPPRGHPRRDRAPAAHDRGARRSRRRRQDRGRRGRATTSRSTTASPTAPLVRLVNSIIFQAAEDGASDVHFEPQEDALVVRFRVDGVLREVQRIPKRMAPGVTTRLKVLAKLDIAERRKPQDGRISLDARRRRAACSTSASRRCRRSRARRSSCACSTSRGSRRRSRSSGSPTRCATQLDEIVRKPTGALLVTGPTGFGQVDDAVRGARRDQPARDQHHHGRGSGRVPARGRQPGADQHKAGLTFADGAALDPALRSRRRSWSARSATARRRRSRSRPRSPATSCSRRCTRTTRRARSRASNEMGVEPFLTASAVSAVLAQRLARKLCANCCEMYQPSGGRSWSRPAFAGASRQRATGWTLYRKGGCPRCNQTGYKGRIGIFQLLG